MPKTILVVDDDAMSRRLAARLLAGAGYEIVEAGSGEEALRVVGEYGGSIDGLVTDFHMPGINGDELGLRLRQALPGLPVLIVSGSWPPYDTRFPVVTKPYEPSELTDAVRQLVPDD